MDPHSNITCTLIYNFLSIEETLVYNYINGQNICKKKSQKQLKENKQVSASQGLATNIEKNLVKVIN